MPAQTPLHNLAGPKPRCYSMGRGHEAGARSSTVSSQGEQEVHPTTTLGSVVFQAKVLHAAITVKSTEIKGSKPGN